ncbi:MAG: hypothetical protein WC383_05990 [Gammaproteobacteria bacterium]
MRRTASGFGAALLEDVHADAEAIPNAAGCAVADDEKSQLLATTLVKNLSNASPGYAPVIASRHEPGWTPSLSGSHGRGGNPRAFYSELLNLGDCGKKSRAAAEGCWQQGGGAVGQPGTA